MNNSTNDFTFENPDNIYKVNKIVQKIIFFALFVPIIFLIFHAVGLWKMSWEYSVALFVYTFGCAIATVFLNAQEHLRKICMYVGLISCCGIVFIVFANKSVNPTISLGVIPIISCLYYNKKLTLIINVINSIFILIASYFRFYPIFPIGFAIGFIMEVFFLTLCTIWFLENLQKSYMQNKMLLINEENLYAELKVKNDSLKDTQYKIIQFTGRCLGNHDYFTGSHVIHTQAFVELISNGLKKNGIYSTNLTDEQIKNFSSAAFLHDIGKVQLPQELFNKNESYTEEELALIKTHPTEGKKLLEFLPVIEDGSFNEIAIQMAYYHHENWDGSGFPCGLKEREIPLCARILAVADALDNLVFINQDSEISVLTALKKIDKLAGTKFDKNIVDATFKLRGDLERIVHNFKIQESNLSDENLKLWNTTHSLNLVHDYFEK